MSFTPALRVSGFPEKQPPNCSLMNTIGTGKSVLLREIIKALAGKHQRHHLAITAPTGVAALNIGGQTIHSWSGIGLGRMEFDRLKWKIKKNPDLLDRWCQAVCLIIDESEASGSVDERSSTEHSDLCLVSMLDGRLFDLLVRNACCIFSFCDLNVP